MANKNRLNKTQKVDNPKRILLLGVMLIFGVIVFIASAVYFTHYSLKEVQYSWEEYHYHLQDKEHFSREIYQELGYGGIIHNFKNYVLRKDTRYRERFLRHSNYIETLIYQKRGEYNLSDAEIAALDAILATILEYRSKIRIVDQAFSEGKSSEEVDKMVKVDDTFALEALAALKNQLIDAEMRLFSESRTLQDFISRLNITTLILLPLMVIVGFLIYRILNLLAHHVELQSLAERRLQAILDNTYEGMITANEDGVIEEFNLACEKIFGWKKEEIIGQNLNVLMVGAHKKNHDTYIKNYLQGGSPKLIGQPREFEVVKKNGERALVEISLAEFYDGDKRYFTGLVRDLTDYKNQNRIWDDAINAMPALVSFLDKNFCYTFVNKTYEKFWEKKREDIVGKSALELLGENGFKTIKPYLERAVQGETVSYEKTLNLPQGFHHFYATYSPQVDSLGNVTGVLAVVHDITERKEKEIDLQRYKEQTEILVQAIEACQIGVTLADPSKEDMPLTFVNKAFEDISGYSREEMIGKNCRFLQGDQTDAKHVDLIRDGINNKTLVNTELLNYRKDGEIFWNNIQIAPVYNEEGELKSFVGTQIDITSLKNAQKQILQERDFSRHIVDFSPSLIVGLDPAGHINFANKSALAMVKYEEEELLGKSWWETFYPPKDPQVKKFLSQFGRDKRVDDFEMTIIDRDGEEHLISWSSFNQYDEEGNIVQIIGAGVDLTKERERAKFEQERHKLQSLGTMAGGIAHEINNALLPIILLSEEYQERHKESGDETQQDLQTIVDYALHARSIVEDVLLYSRQADRSREKYDAGTLFKQSVKFSQDVLQGDTELTLKIDDKMKSASISVNKTGFMQVMSNLIKNASQAMNGEGEVELTLQKKVFKKAQEGLKAGEYVNILIKDHGCGIPKDKLSMIFDPFFTTKEASEGSGLGLSVVYGLVKEWGGCIEVESEEGKGTIFSLFFPLHK